MNIFLNIKILKDTVDSAQNNYVEMFLTPSVLLTLFTSSCNILSYYKNNYSIPFFQMNLLPWLK